MTHWLDTCVGVYKIEFQSIRMIIVCDSKCITYIHTHTYVPPPPPPLPPPPLIIIIKFYIIFLVLKEYIT